MPLIRVQSEPFSLGDESEGFAKGRTDTGAVVYSVGEDGTDDGGRKTNAQGQAYGDGIDISFTLRR